MEVFKDAHEPIISRENFEEVQKTFKAKPGNPKTIEKNIFSGFLKCSDCGCNLNYKTSFGYSGQENHFFSCKNHRAKNSLCSKSHHIRADFLNKYVKNHIVEIVDFANEFEDEFVKIVTNENYKRIQTTQKKNRKKFDDLLLRQKEIDRIIENLYEDKVAGVINEERFTKSLTDLKTNSLKQSSKLKTLKKRLMKKRLTNLIAINFCLRQDALIKLRS